MLDRRLCDECILMSWDSFLCRLSIISATKMCDIRRTAVFPYPVGIYELTAYE